MENIVTRPRHNNGRAITGSPAQSTAGPPQQAHLTRVTLNMPPLHQCTITVPPVIERYPKVLKWVGIGLAVPGVVLYSKGYVAPAIALIGAGFGLGIISAFVEAFISEPTQRFHVIETD